MARIYAPNTQYCGISATVTFTNGVGESDSPALLSWFKNKGYAVEKPEKTQEPPDVLPVDASNKVEEAVKTIELNEMDAEQLKEYASGHNIDIGNSTSVKGILKKITDAEIKG